MVASYDRISNAIINESVSGKDRKGNQNWLCDDSVIFYAKIAEGSVLDHNLLYY